MPKDSADIKIFSSNIKLEHCFSAKLCYYQFDFHRCITMFFYHLHFTCFIMHHHPTTKGIEHHQSCVSGGSAAVDETQTRDEKELKGLSQDGVENQQRGCNVPLSQVNPIINWQYKFDDQNMQQHVNTFDFQVCSQFCLKYFQKLTLYSKKKE